jgi:hypothetical protein
LWAYRRFYPVRLVSWMPIAGISLFLAVVGALRSA